MKAPALPVTAEPALSLLHIIFQPSCLLSHIKDIGFNFLVLGSDLSLTGIKFFPSHRTGSKVGKVRKNTHFFGG